jgi:hypothetical protein
VDTNSNRSMQENPLGPQSLPKSRAFLFMQGGPFYRLERRIGLVRENAPLTIRRAIFAVCITWIARRRAERSGGLHKRSAEAWGPYSARRYRGSGGDQAQRREEAKRNHGQARVLPHAIARRSIRWISSPVVPFV